MSQTPENDRTIELGEVRWRMPVAPLGFDAWMAMSKRMVLGASTPGRAPESERRVGTAGWRAILGWVALVAFFLVVFRIASPGTTSFDGALRDLLAGCMPWGSGAAMGLALFAFMAGVILVLAISARMQRQMYRQAHARLRGLSTPTELVLAENGLRFIGPTVDVCALWSAVTDEFRAADAWIVVLEQSSAVWTQAAALEVDAEAVRAFLRAKAGLVA